MNTRSFIKSLLVAAVAPQVLAPVLADRQRWQCTPAGIWTPEQYVFSFTDSHTGQRMAMFMSTRVDIDPKSPIKEQIHIRYDFESTSTSQSVRNYLGTYLVDRLPHLS